MVFITWHPKKLNHYASNPCTLAVIKNHKWSNYYFDSCQTVLRLRFLVLSPEMHILSPHTFITLKLQLSLLVYFDLVLFSYELSVCD